MRLYTPELKLIILFAFYTILGVTALLYYLVVLEETNFMSTSFQEYFRCESLGTPNNCSKPIQTWQLLVLLPGLLLIGFNTSINFIYVVNWRRAKLQMLRCFRSLPGRKGVNYTFFYDITGQLHSLIFPLVIVSPMSTTISHTVTT